MFSLSAYIREIVATTILHRRLNQSSKRPSRHLFWKGKTLERHPEKFDIDNFDTEEAIQKIGWYRNARRYHQAGVEMVYFELPDRKGPPIKLKIPQRYFHAVAAIHVIAGLRDADEHPFSLNNQANDYNEVSIYTSRYPCLKFGQGLKDILLGRVIMRAGWREQVKYKDHGNWNLHPLNVYVCYGGSAKQESARKKLAKNIVDKMIEAGRLDTTDKDDVQKLISRLLTDADRALLHETAVAANNNSDSLSQDEAL